MAARKARLGTIHHRILDVLKDHPEGIDIYGIRKLIPDIEVQQHLDKRVRELRYFHKVPLKKGGKYFYEGERSDPAPDNGTINKTLRAAVLNMAHGKCQMCGRTIEEDEIKLEADHKIPRTWGGETTLDNLWALCQLCNGGKRDFFSSFQAKEMKAIVALPTVYERIAEMLHLHIGEPVPSWLLEFVANVNDFQEDWQKRLRELRYPVIGLKISSGRTKSDSGKWLASYTLEEWRPLPPDHKKLIKDYEKKLRAKSRSRGPDDANAASR